MPVLIPQAVFLEYEGSDGQGGKYGSLSGHIEDVLDATIAFRLDYASVCLCV